MSDYSISTPAAMQTSQVEDPLHVPADRKDEHVVTPKGKDAVDEKDAKKAGEKDGSEGAEGKFSTLR